MLLNDKQITALQKKYKIIDPFVRRQCTLMESRAGFYTNQRAISYGLSSFGYDIRVGTRFKVFSNIHVQTIDPKAFAPTILNDIDVSCALVKSVLIPPNSFALAASLEYFKIPNDILGIVIGKSTYARCGIIVSITPLEPGWEGHLTIEISNTTPLYAVIHANEGIAQLLLFRGARPSVTYASRKGKYMHQRGIVTAKV